MTEDSIHLNVDAAAAAVREKLPLLRSGVALNHAGIAPQPESETVAEFERRRARLLPGAALEITDGLKSRIRACYARMLRVSPSEIAITRHTAEGVNIIAQGFPWKPGDRVLTVNVEYPSNVYPWWNLRDRGVEVVSVPEREGRVDLNEFLAAIDERVRLVAISHVEFASGFAFDLTRISRECRERDVFLFVDIAQSIGVLPVDLRLVDAAAWPTWKWLMGPLGTGGFYISQRRLPLIRPLFVGTDGMVSTRDYLEYRFEFRADASRFEYSTENTLGLLGTAEALSRLERLLGPDAGDALARRVFGLGDNLITLMESKGFRLYSSRTEGERSGIFSFVAPAEPGPFAKRLRRQRVEAAVRGGRLRLSPHFYNNEEDLQRIALALA
jgi:cysteine desulfurase / selenocysteine lyase